jgi:type II secretory pathway predicted ATPase ExeA
MDIEAIIKYFGFNEHPFISNPDPRFLYFSSQVKEALAKCEFMARDRIGMPSRKLCKEKSPQ